MSDTTSRTLRLLSLLETRRMWAGRELMGRLGVSERTLRRDIDRLRELGYPVRATTGPAGGYQLEAGADMPPLLLDDEEAVAIVVGLRTAAGGTVRGIEETSVRALAKLESLLPPAARNRVKALESSVVPLVRSWHTVDVETLTVVAQAARDHERIRFSYRDRHDAASERSVEPHRLVALHGRWYLLAFDRDRDDWRTFRLDRVAEPHPVRLRFAPRSIPGGDAARYVLRSLETMPMRHHAAVVVEASRDEVEQRLGGHGGVTIEEMGGGRCLLRLQGDSLDGILFAILWLDVGFEVREPAELVDHVSGLADRLSRAVAPA